MNTQHISIDLETLDTRDTAIILSVGIIADTGEALHHAIDIDMQIAEGRTISGSTLLWWLKQNDDARDAITNAKPLSPIDARALILAFLKSLVTEKKYYVWGNAPSFDCDILAHFLGYKPWPWYRERDVRTARMAVPHATKPDTAHDALSDARAQLADAISFMSLCGITNPTLPSAKPRVVVRQGANDASD